MVLEAMWHTPGVTDRTTIEKATGFMLERGESVMVHEHPQYVKECNDKCQLMQPTENKEN